MPEHPTLRYCPDLLRYARRGTRVVMVGDVGIGGKNPLRVQSMITSDTRDTAACVGEVLALAEAGCEIVRITAQTKVYAANLENIAREVRHAGCRVPLVADIHFKPDAALEAAKWVEKVRVNPGNYADKKKFEIRDYDDVQYAAELERIREEFVPLVRLCKELGRSMRIGTNHGSLSDRIMNRHGDTPLGMVESALEFARIAREEGYHDFVFSMKASNPKVMIEAYRLLVARLDEEGPDWNYPIHLGVTEAGDGEDGRIKSAIGIGSLLADGIGDTIRVSLTEDSVHEIPVAKALAGMFEEEGAEQSVGNAERSGCDVPSQSVVAASRGNSSITKRKHTFLPHWFRDGACYAVTFRLAGSLPEVAIKQYQDRKSLLEKRIELLLSEKGSSDATDKLTGLRKELAEAYEELVEQELHRAYGPTHLGDGSIRELVVDALRHFDGERYRLLAWCVMPNHVHVVFEPLPGHEVPAILHSWKSFTAKEANKILGHSGEFWQKEYYDHLIRDADDLVAQVRYVLRNPEFGLGIGWSRWGQSWDDETVRRLRQDAAATDCGGTPQPLAGSAMPRPEGAGTAPQIAGFTPSYNPFSYERRRSSTVTVLGHELGGDRVTRVVTTQAVWNALAGDFARLGDYRPEIILEKSGVVAVDPRDEAEVAAVNERPAPALVTVADGVPLDPVHAFRLLAARLDARHPVLLKDKLLATPADDPLLALLHASRVIGSLLCDGIGDAVLVRGESGAGASVRSAYNILQAAGTRIFKTDYVACPSCGRTLFNLQTTTQKIREATGHLKGVRIAVMGCIVNGPGEMADADFGYVGGAPGKINLYVGKTAVKFNIPAEEAVERLIDLIREHGKWVDAPAPAGV